MGKIPLFVPGHFFSGYSAGLRRLLLSPGGSVRIVPPAAAAVANCSVIARVYRLTECVLFNNWVSVPGLVSIGGGGAGLLVISDLGIVAEGVIKTEL